MVRIHVAQTIVGHFWPHGLFQHLIPGGPFVCPVWTFQSLSIWNICHRQTWKESRMSLLALFDQNLLQIQRLLQLLARPREDHLFEAAQPQEKLGAHHPQRLQGALSHPCLIVIWASASKSQSPSWIKIWKLIQTWKYNGSQFCENFPKWVTWLVVIMISMWF